MEIGSNAGGRRRGGGRVWKQFWAAQFEDVAGWELESFLRSDRLLRMLAFTCMGEVRISSVLSLSLRFLCGGFSVLAGLCGGFCRWQCG